MDLVPLILTRLQSDGPRCHPIQMDIIFRGTLVFVTIKMSFLKVLSTLFLFTICQSIFKSESKRRFS